MDKLRRVFKTNKQTGSRVEPGLTFSKSKHQTAVDRPKKLNDQEFAKAVVREYGQTIVLLGKE